MDFDHLAEKKQEQKAAVWLNRWSGPRPEISSMQIAERHRPGKPVSACLWKVGAFDICYRVRYDTGPHVIVPFASLRRAICRREKAQIEVATMKWIRHNTSIPVPEGFGSGICWEGPYIVMAFLEGRPLSEMLRDSSLAGRPVLNPQINNLKPKRAYSKMASYILELYQHEFDSIGALE